jgi:hypothetical protein
MENKAMDEKALQQFIRDFGFHERLTSDGASEQVGPDTDFMMNIRKYEIESANLVGLNRTESNQ